MEEQVKAELMNRLFSEIEQGWRDQGDRLLVYRLAEEHPELRSELYEFFEDLVLGDGSDVSPEVAAAEDRVTRWIQTITIDPVLWSGPYTGRAGPDGCEVRG